MVVGERKGIDQSLGDEGRGREVKGRCTFVLIKCWEEL